MPIYDSVLRRPLFQKARKGNERTLGQQRRLAVSEARNNGPGSKQSMLKSARGRGSMDTLVNEKDEGFFVYEEEV